MDDCSKCWVSPSLASLSARLATVANSFGALSFNVAKVHTVLDKCWVLPSHLPVLPPRKQFELSHSMLQRPTVLANSWVLPSLASLSAYFATAQTVLELSHWTLQRPTTCWLTLEYCPPRQWFESARNISKLCHFRFVFVPLASLAVCYY